MRLSRHGRNVPQAARSPRRMQCRKVLKLAEAGKSLRAIMDEMNLGLQTIRTIIGRKDYSDRTSVQAVRPGVLFN
jgi:DNA-binding CsgD family transcriptional regulator